MTQEVFVDTAGWTAIFNAKDHGHRYATDLWERLMREDAPLVTTDYVLDETITAVLTRVGHAASVRAGQAILESGAARLVHVADALMRSAWDRYQRFTDKSYSFTDVTSFVVMEQLGIRRAFTFDRHFAQAGFHILD